jgi:phosphoglucomutase
MDCSSPYAMRRLIGLKDRFDVAWACDTDHDRHGVVTRQDGLLSPNEYLAVAIDYLFTHREQWPRDAAVGKTVVTSSLLDRVAARLERRLFETPVGFKWFVEGLGTSTLGFAGEESAGASHLRRNGRVWTTDKDGIVLGLLAAEMTAVTGRDPGALYHELIRDLGEPVYQRIDAPATPREKDVLARLSETDVSTKQLAGAPITQVLTRAPGNNAPIGGVKVITSSGWFAARPSGTEDVYKLYAESFDGPEHLARILAEAQDLVARALRKAQ